MMLAPAPKALDNVALCFATINRPYAAQRLIKSARSFLGTIPIYVADQSAPNKHLIDFYRENQVNVIWMPFDAGVTASRNAIVRDLTEEFFILCDDDFVMIQDNCIEDALDILRLDRGLGILGGRLKDYWKGEYYDRYWELFIHLDKKNRSFTAVPIYLTAPKSTLVGQYRYFHCDAVMNWFVARTKVIQEGFLWDERFKSNGEHEDFFLNLKVNGHWRVAYLPSLLARHKPPETSRYAKLRSRTDGWAKFMDKWGVDQMCEIGNYIRTRDNPGRNIAIGELDRSSFFLSRDLSRDRRHRTATNLLSIQGFDATGLCDANLYDEAGNSDTRTDVTGTVSLLGQQGGVIASHRERRTKRATAVPVRRSVPTSASDVAVAIPDRIKANEDVAGWMVGDAGGMSAVALWYTEDNELITSVELDLPDAYNEHWRSFAIPTPSGISGRSILRISFQYQEALMAVAEGDVLVMSEFEFDSDHSVAVRESEIAFTYSLPIFPIKVSTVECEEVIFEGWTFDRGYRRQGADVLFISQQPPSEGLLLVNANCGRSSSAFAIRCPPLAVRSKINLPRGIDSIKKIAFVDQGQSALRYL